MRKNYSTHNKMADGRRWSGDSIEMWEFTHNTNTNG